MAIDNIVPTTKKPGKLKLKKKIDLSKFDPYTGEKVADVNTVNTKPQNSAVNTLVKSPTARYELNADANRHQTQPVDWFRSAKAGTVGATGAYVLGNLFNASRRTQGLASLAFGGLLAGMSAKRQLSNYNRQQAARELKANKITPRAKAYAELLNEKYNG